MGRPPPSTLSMHPCAPISSPVSILVHLTTAYCTMTPRHAPIEALTCAVMELVGISSDSISSPPSAGAGISAVEKLSLTRTKPPGPPCGQVWVR